ncbi:hypothetical protein IW262DRAFT_1497797 [Armillaria fumosa]|nr:hypothetical protein IW262DRAFT_1497797 [Armillaria fumosa]
MSDQVTSGHEEQQRSNEELQQASEHLQDAISPNISRNTVQSDGHDADDEYDDDALYDEFEITPEILRGLDRAEHDELAASARRMHAESQACKIRLQVLRKAAECPDNQPFFSHIPATVVDTEIESDTDDGMDSQNKGETGGNSTDMMGAQHTAWFCKPKNMSDWLYNYFAADVAPIIFHKKEAVAASKRKSVSTSSASSGKGKSFAKHPIFTQNQVHTPQTMWIWPADPTLLLMGANSFNPTRLW